MERRSTRLIQKATSTQSVVPVNQSEDQALVDGDDLGTSASILRGKKRKASRVESAGFAVSKKARGVLTPLLEMPLDVLFEIFGCLEPLDLLHLGRTSKALRDLLMNRSSVTIWKQALANISNLPECPDDLSEPQWAELVFEKTCHSCDKKPKSIHTSWGARMRLCSKCLPTTFRETNDYEELHHELFDLIPIMKMSRKYGPTRYVHETVLVHASLANTWSMELQTHITDSEKRKWMADMIEEWSPRARHAKACSRWALERQKWIYWGKQKVIDDRKDIIIGHLRSLGWGEELERMAHHVLDLGKIPNVAKACQKDITDQVLSSLEKELTAYMVTVKARRLEREQESLVLKRVAVSREVHNTCISNLPVNAVYPPISEIFRLPFVLDIVDNLTLTGDITKEDFMPIDVAFDDLTRQWKIDKELQLLDLIAHGYDSKELPPPETMFDLAMSFLYCSLCFRFLRHPQVLMHSCTRTFNQSEADLLKDLRSNEVLWNSNKRLGVEKAHVKFIGGLLRMIGLDPKTTKVQEVDVLDPIFECVPCNNIREGRATMSWKTTLVHAFHPHLKCNHSKTPKDVLANLTHLDEAEASRIRPRMLEQEERIRHRTYDSNMVCTHCKRKGNFLDLRKHVQSTHSEANPTCKDIVLGVDANDIPALYRFWPPRFDQSPR